jgi:hypothetical protein
VEATVTSSQVGAQLGARIGAIASKVPGMAWVVVLVLGFLGAAAYGIFARGERAGATRVERVARQDSLVDVERRRAPLLVADSEATIARDHAREASRAVERRHAARPTRVDVVDDTTLAIRLTPSATAADSAAAPGTVRTVRVPIEVVQEIGDLHAQRTADSTALAKDSVKFATVNARASLDSAQLVLATRVNDDDHAAGSGSASTLVVVALTVSAILLTVLTFGRH